MPRRRRSPALRRLTRVRWSMTVAFAAVTALALLVLAAVTLHLDDEARDRDAHDAVVRDAAQVNLVADAHGLDLADFEQSVEQQRPSRWAVLSQGVLLVAGPDQRAVPGDAELARIVATARVRAVKGTEQPVPSFFTAADERGTAVSWIARRVTAVDQSDVPPGSVMLLGEPIPRSAEHARLAGELLLAALLLALGAGLGGHLISGRAMRPALTALEQQEQFLTEAAHELRTPLATLRILVDAPAADAERWSRAGGQVGRLQRIVESLLLRARADTGRYAPELVPLRLDQLVEQTAVELDPTGDAVRVETAASVVRGEPQVLALAVRNLVENALRHGGPPVVVRVAHGVVAVADRGPGIPAERRAAVLRPGVTDGSGTGTGLALVVWAARLHHGALDLAETDGGGLTATLRVPVHRTSSSPHDAERTVDA